MVARKLTPEQLAFMKKRRSDREKKGIDNRAPMNDADNWPPKGGPKNRGEVNLKEGRVLYACSACESGDHDTCEKMQLRMCYCYRWKHKPKESSRECKNAAGYWIKLGAEGTKAHFVKEPAWAMALREAKRALEPKRLIEADDDEEWEDFLDEDTVELDDDDDDEEWEDA